MQADGLQIEHAVVIIDARGIVVDVLADGFAMRLVEGISTGDRLVERAHPDDQDIVEFLVTRAARNRSVAKAEIRWARLNERWSKLITIFAPGGENVRVTVQYEETGSLRRAEQQMRRVVEGSAQGIIVRTRDQVLYMNESFARMLGYSSLRDCLDAPGDADSGIFPEDLPLVLGHLEARLRGEEIISHYEFRLMRLDGTPFWVETHAAIVNWDGHMASLSWITDISQRKAVEDESRRSKEAAEYANRTKTQFLANMSHELRTPLNAILGFSEVIGRQMFGPVAPKYLGYASDIHGSGMHLLDLVNDVLDLSKLEAGRLELRETEVSISALAEECVALLRNRAEEGEVRLSCEVSAGLPHLRADARALKQLLLNFLSNAIKFTPPGGGVRIRGDCDFRGSLSLSVTDTGIGMSEADIQLALTPFGQVDSSLARRHEGTGLGLPICRSLTELHGGEMIVESAPHVGTTVTARFPTDRTVTVEAQASQVSSAL